MSVYGIVGGTGTFGNECARQLLRDGHTVRIISRGELAQARMRADLLIEFPDLDTGVGVGRRLLVG